MSCADARRRVAALACGAGVAVIGGQLLGINRGLVAGVFCGALTNTPALGAAADRLAGTPLAQLELDRQFSAQVTRVRRADVDILPLGALVTLSASATVLTLARTWGRASVTSCLGTATGMQTQPATLSAAFELCGRSEETYVAYALVYPTAMLGKILLAQLIVMLG